LAKIHLNFVQGAWRKKLYSPSVTAATYTEPFENVAAVGLWNLQEVWGPVNELLNWSSPKN